MTATTANLLNATILIGAGIYGYFGITGTDGNHSLTALIPAIFGLVLLLMHNGIKKSNKVISHIAVTLTLILLIMCILRFVKISDWDAKKYIFLVCIISNAIALLFFIRSFIDARKNRLANNPTNA